LLDIQSEHLFGFNDMNKISLHGDDLEGMISKWESTLERCKGNLDKETILQPMLYGLIEKYGPLKASIDYYDLCDAGHSDRTYDYLLKACKKLINKRKYQANRADVQQLIAGDKGGGNGKVSGGAATEGANIPPGPGTSADVDNKGAPAKGAGKGAALPSPFDRQDATERGLCFKFQNGTCPHSSDDCPFTHTQAKRSKPRRRTPSPTQVRTWRPPAEIPCRFFLKGTCSGGVDCKFKHDTTVGSPSAVDAKDER
jgi:hypothetical protein